jgi:D,D-heptose 1,7-bisphosphate phosphatase
MSQPAIFLDKDGTVIVNMPYNVDPDLIVLMPGVGEGLQRLQASGFQLVMITNQAGVAHGYFPERALEGVHARIDALLEPHGVRLGGFYYCPHHPQGSIVTYKCTCLCRKPMPGMIQRAAAELRIDLGRSWFLGDILDDVEAGNRAGCRTVLVDAGSETLWQLSPQRTPDYYTYSMQSAVDLILARSCWPVPASLQPQLQR